MKNSVRHFIKQVGCKKWLKNVRSFASISYKEKQYYGEAEELIKTDPVQICTELWVKSFAARNINTPFVHLSGFLSKFDLWVLGYQRVVALITGNFPSRDHIRPLALHDLLSLRNAVIRGHFKWNTRTQVYIRSPNEKPITEFTSKAKIRKMLESKVPLFQDKIVQEVLFFILEPLFESRFSSKSHAFRPGRNAHTVIRTIRSNFAEYLWYLRVDLSEALQKVDTGLAMSCLQKVVKDKKVLNLIKYAFQEPVLHQPDDESNVSRAGKENKKKGDRRKVLKPNEAKPDPYWLRTFFEFAPEEASTVPNYGHCGILSPLLANVILSDLDKMIEDKIAEFSTVDTGCHNPAWPEFVPSEGKDKTIKMDYIRYGGHFLIGIRGPRKEAVEMRRVLLEFCGSKLGMELNDSKVEIEHVSRGIQFLDHNICRSIIRPTLHYTATGGATVRKKGVATLLTVTASLPECVRRFRRLKLLELNKDPEPLPCTAMLYSSQAHTNMQMNKFLETMADWYRYADNRKKTVGFCAYVIRSSLAKLYANRYKLKSRAKVYGIASRDLSGSLRGKEKGIGNNVAKEYSDLVKLGIAAPIESVQFSHRSLIPKCDYTPFPRVWVPEHEQVFLEYIKLQDPKYFFELLKSFEAQGLNSPQTEMCKIVWDFKSLGVRRVYGINPKNRT